MMRFTGWPVRRRDGVRSPVRRRGGMAAFLVALGLVGAAHGHAQVRMTVPPQSEPIALRGATIHTVADGTIENGTIVFQNGVITALGTDVTLPPGTRVVDATGKHLYPGLIDAYSTVGITEIGAVGVSNDVNELGDFNPNVRAEVAVNGESRHIGTTRTAGVLVTVTTPGGGLVSGMSSALNLEGWTWEEMSLEGTAALNVNWPNPLDTDQDEPSYGQRVRELRDFFADARAYRDAVEAGEVVRTDSRYAAMIPALKAVIANHSEEQTPIVLEGDYVLPELLLKERDGSAWNPDRVRAVFLYEPDEQQLIQNFLSREPHEGEQTGRAMVSRLYGEWLKKECSKYDLPALPARPWDTLLDRIISVIG